MERDLMDDATSKDLMVQSIGFAHMTGYQGLTTLLAWEVCNGTLHAV